MSLFKRPRTEPAESVVEPAEPDPAPVPSTPLPEDTGVVEVRALRAQVRVLEQALERIVDPPDLESYRAQVRAAVTTVARGTGADDDPRAALARISVAIARIDAPPTGRVLLPPPATPAVPEPATVVEPRPEAAASTGPAPADQPEGTSEPAGEVVLPVPPPAPVPHGRSRRRRSRSAA